MDDRSEHDPLGIQGVLLAEKYRLGSAGGRGGHSVVYKAEHLIWKTPVAIKCFTSLSRVPEEARAQLLAEFVQEGKLMTSLSTRTAAVVQARDIGTFVTPNGLWLPYLVLEWLDGRSLAEWLHGPPRAVFTLHEVMALLEPVATALEIAHGMGIAHRDIKPENLFVVGDPREIGAQVKLLDFGVAKVMASPAATSLAQTGAGVSSFTPEYGAPEQFSRAFGATGPWTDVYAMALVIVEMLLGRSPLGDSDDYMRLASVTSDPTRRPTPRGLGLAVSTDVEAVFARALALQPAGRYPTLGAFWSALFEAMFPGSSWVMSTSVSTSRARSSVVTPSPHVVAAPRSEAAASAPGAPSAAGAPKRLRRFLPFAAALAVAFAGGAAFLTLRPPGAPASLARAAAPMLAARIGAPPPGPAPAPDHCPEGMVLVGGGRFFMGSDDPAFKLWQPSHNVALDTFCIDRYEVTVARYTECTSAGACPRPPAMPDYPKPETTSQEQHEKNRAAYAELCNFGKPGREQHPINCVAWFDAARYCSFAKTRLPTEAEWEFAARGSDGRKFPWGDEVAGPGFMNACGKECNAWEVEHDLKPSVRMYEVDDGFAGTAPVGSFGKGVTKLGAYDMVGNVWEWTADWFVTYGADDVVNPKGAAAGDRKAIRGGAFNGGVVLWHNPAFRYHQLATATSHGIGFRCAADLTAARPAAASGGR